MCDYDFRSVVLLLKHLEEWYDIWSGIFFLEQLPEG